ncbi:peptide ABC transporter substrate-binding protein [Tannockella kyphosi]|uniref:peptide ABC transporter substrate-binding protein n=1 Tax=Tannockella kyphosi TaxID=2899121 RepID=UPI0020117E63|nr:peptide ABC transporter substrate-binding protein [Tannockella kyphosi]
MKKFITMVAFATMAFSLVGCSSDDTASTDDGAWVTIAKENDVISMDSMYATDGDSFAAIHATIDGLMDQDADGNIIASLAESYDVSDDGLVYTFYLREAYWSNGTQVTAADFVFAWNGGINSADCEYAYLFTTDGAAIAGADEILYDGDTSAELGVVAVDDLTLEVTLSQDTPYFLSLMTFPVFYPINEEFYDAQDGDYGLTPENLISCGPYTLTSWEKGSSLTFTTSETYWDAEAVQVDGFEIQIMAEVSSSVTAFEAEEVDFTKVSSDLISLYQDSDEFTSVLEGYLWYFQFNLYDEVAGNYNLRMAIAYALDNEDLCENVLQDGSIVADGFVPYDLSTGPDGEDYRDTADVYFEQDLDLAAYYWELAQDELGEEITIELLYENADPALSAAEYLQSQLQEALPGLTISMNMQTKEARIELQKDVDFQMVLTRWGPDYADPTTYLNMYITGGAYNYGGYSNDAYDTALDNAAAADTDEERWQYLKDAEAIMMEDLPVIPIFQVGGASLISSSVTGIETHAVGVSYVYKNLAIVE